MIAMRRLFDGSWPITLKVPLAVAALMMLVGFVLSERVLSRLTDTQERHLIDLSRSYLDGLSSAIAPSILREDNWEVFDAIARAQELNKSLRPAETIVTNADGIVIAASDPKQHPINSTVKDKRPGTALSDNEIFSFDAGANTASATRILSYPGRTAGIIYASFDTRHLAAERQNVVITLVLTNGVLTILLAAAGWLLVARMMRPVRILSQHLGVDQETLAVAIPDRVVAETRGEFNRLFHGYNALVRSMKEREDLGKRLAEEKRLGSLGRMASAIAHEINNPLGGLFNAVSTLKAHGHLSNVRNASLGLLERGLTGIRDVVRTTLAIYRTDAAPRDLAPADINDLGLLITPEARRKSIQIVIDNALTGSVPIPSTPIRQAILNLVLNAVAAAPDASEVSVSSAATSTQITIVVIDRGPGLPPPAAEVLTGRSGAPPPIEGGGLGLWTINRLITDLGGTIEVERPLAGGTAVRLLVPFADVELSDVA
ncbi:HAMP domain-containing sensor histidine kinase [Rhodopseudomonas palustris]|uniref:sensor histidine kinase n=1 Tax=Rhodopseudomonas palustris TaxID=1076 RepID=UPI002ACD4383|nr:HAMP domain-containing sensor histidine kinase [Rhodopseudomonas palustris]WQH01313.1 HAMP domain-containing sensor histidine kinase [Rhodopseudomonas palustris]